METIYLIFGFAGSWLIFAGSVYQAYLELSSQGIERERIQAYMDGVPAEPTVSPWWWLVPPVRYVLASRRLRIQRTKALQAMPPDEVAGLIDFGTKATGWLLVALGGLCIAAKETYELTEHYGLPLWQYVGVIVGMILVSLLNARLQTRRSERIKQYLSE